MQEVFDVADLADASANGEWDAELRSDVLDGLELSVSAFDGGSNIEENEFIGAFDLVSGGKFGG